MSVSQMEFETKGARSFYGQIILEPGQVTRTTCIAPIAHYYRIKAIGKAEPGRGDFQPGKDKGI